MVVETLRGTREARANGKIAHPAPPSTWFSGYGHIDRGLEGVVYSSQLVTMDQGKVGTALQTWNDFDWPGETAHTFDGPRPMTPEERTRKATAKAYLIAKLGYSPEELEEARIAGAQDYRGKRNGQAPFNITLYH